MQASVACLAGMPAVTAPRRCPGRARCPDLTQPCCNSLDLFQPPSLHYSTPHSCWTDDDCSQADDHVFQKLVALFEGRASLEGRAAASLEGGVGRPALSWDQLVDLAQHAQLGDQFVLRWV